jgi:hypothetical protein
LSSTKIGQLQAELVAVEFAPVAGDDPVLLERPQPAQARRR